MKMTSLYISLIFLLGTTQVYSQAASTDFAKGDAKKIEAIEIEQLTDSEYATQALNWEEEVSKNAQNESAWLNLYKAARYSSVNTRTKKISKEKQESLNDILARMQNAVPNSFAYQYASYLNGSKSDDSFIHLKSAYQLHPEDPELLDDMLCEALIRNDGDAITKFSNLLSRQNIYNATEVEYNRNVLNSVEQNAVLITGGNVDTYPLILMQQLQNFRTDVSIVSLEWLNSKNFQARVSKALGIETTSNLNISAILEQTNKPVYLTLTSSADLIQQHTNKLFCTGLAMKYSNQPVENISSLTYNWEFLFTKKHLQENDLLNRNYILPLLLLKDYYTAQGKLDQASEINTQVEQLIQRFSIEKQVKKHLD